MQRDEFVPQSSEPWTLLVDLALWSRQSYATGTKIAVHELVGVPCARIDGEEATLQSAVARIGIVDALRSLQVVGNVDTDGR